jgi:hypothetical protein
MPYMCFSYPAAGPAGSEAPEAAQSGLGDLRRMPWSCYSYPAMCFSYPDDMPPGGRHRDIGPASLPGLREMPSMCFRY